MSASTRERTIRPEFAPRSSVELSRSRPAISPLAGTSHRDRAERRRARSAPRLGRTPCACSNSASRARRRCESEGSPLRSSKPQGDGRPPRKGGKRRGAPALAFCGVDEGLTLDEYVGAASTEHHVSTPGPQSPLKSPLRAAPSPPKRRSPLKPRSALLPPLSKGGAAAQVQQERALHARHGRQRPVERRRAGGRAGPVEDLGHAAAAQVRLRVALQRAREGPRPRRRHQRAAGARGRGAARRGAEHDEPRRGAEPGLARRDATKGAASSGTRRTLRTPWLPSHGHVRRAPYAPNGTYPFPHALVEPPVEEGPDPVRFPASCVFRLREMYATPRGPPRGDGVHRPPSPRYAASTLSIHAGGEKLKKELITLESDLVGGPEVSTMAESEQHGRVLGDMLDLRKELMRTIALPWHPRMGRRRVSFCLSAASRRRPTASPAFGVACRPCSREQSKGDERSAGRAVNRLQPEGPRPPRVNRAQAGGGARPGGAPDWSAATRASTVGCVRSQRDGPSSLLKYVRAWRPPARAASARPRPRSS